MTEDTKQEAICNALGIFPEEIEHLLPVNIGKHQIEKLEAIINSEVISVLEELEKAGQNALNHTGERDALRGCIQKIKERYNA